PPPTRFAEPSWLGAAAPSPQAPKIRCAAPPRSAADPRNEQETPSGVAQESMLAAQRAAPPTTTPAGPRRPDRQGLSDAAARAAARQPRSETPSDTARLVVLAPAAWPPAAA